MTFDQQADLLMYLYGLIDPPEAPATHATLTILVVLDQAQVDDLWMTAQRLRRMAPYEDAIKRVVTGQ